MMDDPLEWLTLALDDDEPTVPDAPGWQDALALGDDTWRTTALDDEAPPEDDWELEIESELRPPLRLLRG